MSEISVLVFDNNTNTLGNCIESINNQTCKDIETIVIDANITKESNVHKPVGEYLLFMSSSFYFENDTVLEDVLLNITDEDIIICDTVCNKDTNPLSREHIISGNIETACDLIASDVFKFHSIFIRTEILKDYESDIFRFNNIYSINLFLINEIINKKRNWKHLHIPVLHLDVNKTKFDKDFKIDYTIEYKELLKRIIPLFFKDYERFQQLKEKEINEEQKILEKFGKTIFFRLILKARNQLLKTSYYEKKALRRTNDYNNLQDQKDIERKHEVEKAIDAIPFNLLTQSGDENDIIVSLTSHKRRVIDSAPYAIYSMFTQTVLPNKIVLFINREDWSLDTLPPIIKRLMQSGLEVEFCEDVRSHTKLIPALQKFPENPIITIDDDIYYNDKTIEELLTAYNKSDKKTVICHQGCYPQKRNGHFLPYSDWETSKYKGRDKTKTSLSVSAYGVSGVIYPPHIFPNEVFDKDVFLKIAPHTDDIWFWIMEYKNGIKVSLIEESSQEKNVSVNYGEYVNPDSSLALYFENCFNGRNDKELQSLLEYYCIE